jgi:hypothetical protein
MDLNLRMITPTIAITPKIVTIDAYAYWAFPERRAINTKNQVAMPEIEEA